MDRVLSGCSYLLIALAVMANAVSTISPFSGLAALGDELAAVFLYSGIFSFASWALTMALGHLLRESDEKASS